MQLPAGSKPVARHTAYNRPISIEHDIKVHMVFETVWKGMDYALVILKPGLTYLQVLD